MALHSGRALGRLVLAGPLLVAAVAAAAEPWRIGFIDPALPAAPPPRNAAALAFAKAGQTVTRLKPLPAGAWQDETGRSHAPEEFDLVWFHQGDDAAAASLPEPCGADLLAYVEGGGSLLLSGAAARLVNDLGLEPTPVRVLGATEVAYVSGVIPAGPQRSHPVFVGFDTAAPILLTSKGGNALADFYGTPGPHGTLLAEGNAGLGERPLVEYKMGSGTVIFVGWRLPDFTTAEDAHRPNQERLFANLFAYLAGANRNRARPLVPQGPYQYARVLGVPMLRTAQPEAFAPVAAPGQTVAVVLTAAALGEGAMGAADAWVSELALGLNPLTVTALGVTLCDRPQPAHDYLARRQAEQEAAERGDRERLAGLRVLTPDVRWTPAPLAPGAVPDVDTSVLLGRSPYMAPGEGRGDITPVYEPLEDGGFRITGSRRQLNRPIVHGQNRVWTGDVPLFRMDTVTGNGSYVEQERAFPLWPRPGAEVGNVNPCLGTLRLGVRAADGHVQWLDEAPGTTAVFRPGYTRYDVPGPAAAWRADVCVAPALEAHGLVCRVEFDHEVALVWQYGGVWWEAGEANRNRVETGAREVRITEPNLPNGLVLAGWDGDGTVGTADAPYGQRAEFAASAPRRLYHLVVAWGVTTVDQARLDRTLARFDSPNTAAWPQARDRLRQLWRECYIDRALDPASHVAAWQREPAAVLDRTCQWWDRRRAEFQVRTPDPHLNALVNWVRCTTEYHRQGPGLVLGGQIWQMYSHISTGWYGRQWAGDHQSLEECLRLYAAMQADDGFIRWVSPSLVAFHAENNSPYWVDQVWWHYAWTGDRTFAGDLWPAVRRAVAWMRRQNDPDDDGLFRDFYEYWNCDSNGKGPKAAAPSTMAWAMLDRAARLAEVVGDAEAVAEYRRLADRTRDAVLRELWREDAGRLGCIGADGLWRGHPQTWEEYLAVNTGLLDAEHGRRAMRWLAAHYGFEPNPGVRLLACSDWWPIRWSVQWVPTGDTCLAVQAGLRSGDVDLWYPYLQTVVGSAFRSDFPGVNMGISNAGAGGGDREDVDSVDPHLQVVLRGLFGIEPALHMGELRITPAFPTAWDTASLHTPDLDLDFRRDGDAAVLRVRTPQPTVKRVRANLTGPEVVTAAEVDSTVRAAFGPAVPPAAPAAAPPVLAEQQPPPTPPALAPEARSRLVVLDLSAVCNATAETMTETAFVFDYADQPAPLRHWWGNPGLRLLPGPRSLVTPSGVVFLTTGKPRPGLGPARPDRIALASWKPYPFPAAVTVPVQARCERLWLLLQAYVHPMKNYVPNGEVVLHYATGPAQTVQLIPPLNLDTYFQHFSREGEPVDLGQLVTNGGGFGFVHGGLARAHADSLAVPCDPTRELAAIELRATCSEGVLALLAATLLATP